MAEVRPSGGLVGNCGALVAGETVRCPNAREILYTTNEAEYRMYIEPAYSYASQLLLDLFNNKYELMNRLR